jgi:hypothetical protein
MRLSLSFRVALYSGLRQRGAETGSDIELFNSPPRCRTLSRSANALSETKKALFV